MFQRAWLIAVIFVVTVSYYESTRGGLQFQYHDQYSIVTQALVLAPENVHISLT